MKFDLAEEDRQTILLAIARLSVERPAWLNFLEEIAVTLNGPRTFAVFRQYALEESADGANTKRPGASLWSP